jgi:hypothetical protein
MSVQRVLSWIGWVSVVAGVIAAFSFADKMGLDQFAGLKVTAALGGGVIGGLLLVGFAKIIDLLQESVNTQDDKLRELIKEVRNKKAV